MISKIKAHKSARRLVNYMTKKEGFTIIQSNLMATKKDEMIEEIASQMSLSTDPRCKVKLLHIVHSLHKDDIIGLEAWKWQVEQTAKMYAGDKNLKTFAGLHNDTDEIHCHQLLCVIGNDGKACDRSWEKYRIRKIDVAFENKYNTTRTKDLERERLERELEQKAFEADGITPPDHIEIKTVPLSKEEIEKAERLYAEGKKDNPVADRLLLQKDIEELIYDSADWDELVAKGKDEGISIKPFMKDGVVTGCSYGKGEVVLKGSLCGLDGRSVTKLLNHKQYAAETDLFDGERLGHGYAKPTPQQETMIEVIGDIATNSKSMKDFEDTLTDAEVKYQWDYDHEGKRAKIIYGEGDDAMTGTNAGYNIRQLREQFNEFNKPKETYGNTTDTDDDFLHRHGANDDFLHRHGSDHTNNNAPQEERTTTDGDGSAAQDLRPDDGQEGESLGSETEGNRRNKSRPVGHGGKTLRPERKNVRANRPTGGAERKTRDGSEFAQRRSRIMATGNRTKSRFPKTEQRLDNTNRRVGPTVSVVLSTANILLNIIKMTKKMQLDTEVQKVKRAYTYSGPRPRFDPPRRRPSRPGHDL